MDSGLDIQFKLHDFVTKDLSDKYNMATFGFQINSEMLHQKENMFQKGALLIVPLSQGDHEVEQDYSVLKYAGDGQFDTVESIMRTAFARRVDRIQEAEESLDTDYFNNSQRFDKIEVFEKLVKDLETEFKAKTEGK